jgi:hypothetical protein
VFVATVSHFSELKADLEVLGFGCSAYLTEDKADALWIRVRTASDLLPSYVPSSIARYPPGDTRKGVLVVACVVNPYSFV